MKYSSRNVEMITTYIDQAQGMYLSFIGGIIGIFSIIMYRWIVVKETCTSWTSNSRIETMWTVVPVVFLMWSLVQAISVLYGIESERREISTVVKAIGHQWYWEYGQKDGRITESRVVGSMEIGSPKLTLVDQPLYIGTGTGVGIMVGSADVLHAWSVPGLGVKVDGVPGRTSMVTSRLEVEGVYSGYCAELCGTGHGFMPIQVVGY